MENGKWGVYCPDGAETLTWATEVEAEMEAVLAVPALNGSKVVALISMFRGRPTLMPKSTCDGRVFRIEMAGNLALEINSSLRPGEFERRKYET